MYIVRQFTFFTGQDCSFAHADQYAANHYPINKLLDMVGVENVCFQKDSGVITVWPSVIWHVNYPWYFHSYLEWCFKFSLWSWGSFLVWLGNWIIIKKRKLWSTRQQSYYLLSFAPNNCLHGRQHNSFSFLFFNFNILLMMQLLQWIKYHPLNSKSFWHFSCNLDGELG